MNCSAGSVNGPAEISFLQNTHSMQVVKAEKAFQEVANKKSKNLSLNQISLSWTYS